MIHLAVTLHTLGVRLTDTVHEKKRLLTGERDQGSVTIEQVLWAVAVIGIVAIVVGAVTAYVRSQSGKLGATTGP